MREVVKNHLGGKHMAEALHKTLEPMLKLTGTKVRKIDPDQINNYNPNVACDLNALARGESVGGDTLVAIHKYEETVGEEVGVFVASWTLPNWMTAAYWLHSGTENDCRDSSQEPLLDYSDEWNESLVYIDKKSIDGLKDPKLLLVVETWLRAIHAIFTEKQLSYHSATCGCSKIAQSRVARLEVDEFGMPDKLYPEGLYYVRFNGVLHDDERFQRKDTSILLGPITHESDLRKQLGHALQVRNADTRSRRCPLKKQLQESILANILQNSNLSARYNLQGSSIAEVAGSIAKRIVNADREPRP